MRVVQLDNFEQVREFGKCWNDLLDTSRDNHVFLTLEWLETWWRHFGADRESLFLIVIENGKILALAPLMNSTYRLSRIRLKNIEFVGTPASDYQSFILIADSSRSTRMILDYMKREAWDCIELKNIPEGSETAKGLRANSGKPIKFKERITDICPFVHLPKTFEEYLKLHRVRRRLKSLFRLERKFNREHRVEYKSFSQMDITLEEAMETFFRLHQQRWQSQGFEGRFALPAFRNFHMDIAKRFNKRGWLNLNFLTVDDKPVSVDYGFVYGPKIYAYLTGFGPHHSKYSVGNINKLRRIEHSIKRGLREIDLLRVGHSHKEHWASMTRRTVELSAMSWKLVAKTYEWLVRSNIVPSLSSRLRKRAFYHKVQSTQNVELNHAARAY